MEEETFALILTLLQYPGNVIIRRNTARLLRNLSFDVTTHDRIAKFLPEVGSVLKVSLVSHNISPYIAAICLSVCREKSYIPGS